MIGLDLSADGDRIVYALRKNRVWFIGFWIKKNDTQNHQRKEKQKWAFYKTVIDGGDQKDLLFGDGGNDKS